MKQLKEILIVRTDRIGDVVLTLPLAGLIKKYLPDSKLSFLLRKYTEPLAAQNPYIDRIITIGDDPRKLSYSEINKVFKKYNFDAAIFVSPALKTVFAAFRNRVKIRIGSGYRWYSFLFNKKIFEHRKYGTKHELEHNIDMLKKIGITEKISPESVEFNIQPSGKSRQLVRKFIDSAGTSGSVRIIVHPGSGGSAVDLPLAKLRELVNMISNNLDCQLFLTGASAEADICAQTAGGSKAVNLAGKLELDTLIELISRSDMLIANSTGPLHIAAALKKTVVGFFPRVPSCSVRRWGPYIDKRLIFEPEINCQKCTIKQCANLNCMDSINIGTVFEKIRETIDSGKL